MEIVFSLSICDVVEHDLRLDLYSCSFSVKETLETLKHLKNMYWVHAPVLVVIAKLKHYYNEVVYI